MSEDIEDLTLKCPICQSDHTFKLAVDRSHVIYHMTSDMVSRKPPVQRYRRMFTCPEKKKPFQATIVLEESFGTVLHGVKVVREDVQ